MRKADRCYCCGRFMPEGRGYPPLEEDRCEDCEARERPSRLYRTGLRNTPTHWMPLPPAPGQHAKDALPPAPEASQSRMLTGTELGGLMCGCGHCSHQHFKNHPLAAIRDGCSACNCTEFVPVPEADASPAKGGASLIVAERARQVTAEGWTPDHDDEHDTGELVAAARTYAKYAERQSNAQVQLRPSSWPWEPSSWKPSADPIHNLVKAGALIAAEIDRLLRRNKAEADASPKEPR